jgi:hypothetical protein
VQVWFQVLWYPAWNHFNDGRPVLVAAGALFVVYRGAYKPPLLFEHIQTPLLSITLDYCDGNFAPVNIALLVAGSPLLLLPWYLDRYLKRPADARNNPKHETELALRQPLSPREELSITVALRKDDGLGTPPPVVGRNPSSFGNTRRRVTSAEGKNRQFAHGEFEELSEGEE